MCVVDHNEGVEFFSEGDDLWQRCEATIHAKDAVGHHHDFTGTARLLKHATQPGHVSVWIDFTRCPVEAYAIDDAGVVELVADDDVLGKHAGRDNSQVACIAVLEGEEVFGRLEPATLSSGCVWCD